jgi:GMP synthase (glutamine-hydrolysing)
MNQSVLIVVHQEHSSPGRVGEMLEARGYHLERRCPNRGDPLPERLDAYAAALIFGGPMSANDDGLPGIRAELEWLERSLGSECPMLGICLGAQLMARALGARVGAHRDGLVEIGWHEVRPTAAANGFLDRPRAFYQWHRETFEIPDGGAHLAENDAFPAQAFAWEGRVFGVEFHPEMTLPMIDRWTSSEKGALQLSLPGAQARELQLEAYARLAPESDRWLARFLDQVLLRRGPSASPRSPVERPRPPTEEPFAGALVDRR